MEMRKAQKRKHTAAVDASGAGEPSAKRPKKEKQKDAKKHKLTKTDKGKGRATDDAFRVVRASLSVSVPPVFAVDLRGGVEELLDSMLMRYIPALQGVVLAHDRLEFLDKAASIKADNPFANCRIAFDATVWSPQVGMKLSGKINLCSPDHISLLVHRTFNVSIPRHHITTDNHVFEYGPTENDPEFGAEATNREGDQEEVDGGGRWVHKITGDKLGDADGYLEFTVIGLTIANQMVSLMGSIQPNPFSPEHVPKAVVSTAPARKPVISQPPSALQSEREVDAMVEDDDSNIDPFEKLGKLADDAERQAREAEAQKEKKRKRKDKKAALKADVAAGKKSKRKS